MTSENSLVIQHFVEQIKNKKLLPKPHLSVISVRSEQEQSSGLFTLSDKPSTPNAVGYDFVVDIKNKENAEVITSFEFFVRQGLVLHPDDLETAGFERVVAKISSSIMSGKVKITIQSEEQTYVDQELPKCLTVKSKDFFEFDWENVFEISYFSTDKGQTKTDKNPIRIHFKKNIETLGNGVYKIQVQIKNLSLLDQRQIFVRINDRFERNSVNLGLLLDYSITEDAKHCNFLIKEGRSHNFKTSIKRISNLTVQNETESKMQFSDYYIGNEVVPKLRSGKRIDDFLSAINSKKNALHPVIGEVFKKMWGENGSFYKYQEQGIEEMLNEIEQKTGKVNIVSVRTAGGKTETFAVPVLNHCLNNIDRVNTKALVFYPTKSLANDQASRFFTILYHVNKILEAKRFKRKITFGIYHGDIKGKSSDDSSIWLPFKCPECQSLVAEKKIEIDEYLCCKKCNITFDFCLLTKYQIHEKMPDIVITNQDTLNVRLMSSPESHSILGREVHYNKLTGETALKGNKNDKNIVKISPAGVPEIIVFDEVHLLKGAFGMNTSLLLKRLETILRKYSGDDTYKPTYIGASATIKDTVTFAKKLFHNREITVIPNPANSRDTYELSTDKNIQRKHLFLLPTAFASAETTAFGVSYILDYYKNKKTEKPHILGFNNSIKDCRDLISRSRERSKGYRIQGHTAQFEKEQRAETERAFSKGEVDVLYSTSTLEVGVDFDDINVLIIHGAPYSFNDYLQRVGRSGRKKDAAVITSLRSWNPIDYFYYENCRVMLENPSFFIETPPINERNSILLENHIRCSFFDYLCYDNDTSRLTTINELKSYLTSGKDVNRIDETIKKEIREFILSSFPGEETLIDQALAGIEKEIFVELPTNIQYIQGRNGYLDYLCDKEQIDQLRNADKEIEVEFVI